MAPESGAQNLQWAPPCGDEDPAEILKAPFDGPNSLQSEELAGSIAFLGVRSDSNFLNPYVRSAHNFNNKSICPNLLFMVVVCFHAFRNPHLQYKFGSVPYGREAVSAGSWKLS